MISITKSEKQELDRVGLLRYKKNGRTPQEQNFVVANKQHRSRDKSYYVVEEQAILLFLQKYDNLNLQKIRPEQVRTLKEKNLVNESKIQYPHEYKPNAIIFVDSKGQYRMKKITNLMIALGIWKSTKN